MQAWLPTYFAQELGLDMKASALFSALPFATMALGSLVSGQAASALLGRMAPFEVRKRMVALSSIVPACSLLALSYVKSPAAALGLLVTALGAHSFSSGGLHAHVTDVAPHASEWILGFMNTVGVLLGIVTNMRSMFYNATSFNQPLNDWNVSNVTDMESMFWNARSFNHPLNDWNASNVTDMHNMFRNANSFNQPLNDWNVSNVTNMCYMFCDAT